MSLVECVPNFSDGREPQVLRAIVAAIEGVRGARVLDASADRDHDRAVVTLAGEAEAVGEAAFAAVREAARRIDLRAHRGVHPRMGAADVVPFVPLAGSSLELCVALAHAVGARVGDELGIPVYFYGDAALRPGRRALPEVRRGGFEGIAAALERGEAARLPDAGPARVHPTAGASAIGVRPFLIAFNVDLETRDVEVARTIARAVREAGGGLPAVRALGLLLPERGVAQVSMNLCDHRRTGVLAAFEEVERRARELGVAVRASELVGLAPEGALDAGIARRVRLVGFDPARHLVEARLRAGDGA